jgi:hypothetical protein
LERNGLTIALELSETLLLVLHILKPTYEMEEHAVVAFASRREHADYEFALEAKDLRELNSMMN